MWSGFCSVSVRGDGRGFYRACGRYHMLLDVSRRLRGLGVQFLGRPHVSGEGADEISGVVP